MITIALSTSIPIATINAPNDMRCNVVPMLNKIGNETAIVSIRPNPIMKPLRNPMVNINTNMTITTDSSRLTMNELMASSTLSG